eukprot:982697-Amphidinium_carterae.1
MPAGEFVNAVLMVQPTHSTDQSSEGMRSEFFPLRYLHQMSMSGTTREMYRTDFHKHQIAKSNIVYTNIRLTKKCAWQVVRSHVPQVRVGLCFGFTNADESHHFLQRLSLLKLSWHGYASRCTA